jgi:HD-GYP domain-containing protein (c-di-GMP phosphodiesterase class II)
MIVLLSKPVMFLTLAKRVALRTAVVEQIARQIREREATIAILQADLKRDYYDLEAASREQSKVTSQLGEELNVQHGKDQAIAIGSTVVTIGKLGYPRDGGYYAHVARLTAGTL